MNALPVVFENDEILLINKRAGLAVQGGARVSHPVDELLAEQTGRKVYPVHRLDKDTSGLLLVAKSSAAAAKWTALIASGSVRKQYTAICVGIPGEAAPGSSGVFRSDVGSGRERRSALTEYKILATAEAPPCAEAQDREAESVRLSLLELALGTGRTHQIRIHLAQSGCPVAADDKHGNFRVNKILRRAAGIRTLQLAATRLTLPIDGRARVFSVPLPEHMRSAAESLFARPPRTT